MADWSEVAAFLAGGEAFGETPEVIETHTARVHLTAGRAWKLRRPVDYGWLDYSTRARRRLCAEREIQWNGAGAPGLYEGLGGVTDGPRLIRPGEEVPEEAEALVVMRRFDRDCLFDAMARAGRIDEALMRETGRTIGTVHRQAPACDRPVRLPAMARGEVEGLESLAGMLGRERVAELARALEHRAAALSDEAAARPVRRCHGDLHLRNIVLWQGRPAPFDCIDFNLELIEIDPLYDLAFLLMDLDHRELGALGPAVFDAWAEALARDGEEARQAAYGGLALAPLYKALRAAIRAKTGALAADGAEGEDRAEKVAEAASYVELALDYLLPAPPPRVIAVGGRSGTGKSTLARGLAAETGAVVLRSDAIRKALFGVEETERLGPEGYTEAASAATYGEMAERARLALAGGASVILDAAHLEPQERARAEALADEAGARFEGLWLEASAGTLAARVEARTGDASDATGHVVAMQLDRDVGQIGWARIPADGPAETVLARARAALATG